MWTVENKGTNGWPLSALTLESDLPFELRAPRSKRKVPPGECLEIVLSNEKLATLQEGTSLTLEISVQPRKDRPALIIGLDKISFEKQAAMTFSVESLAMSQEQEEHKGYMDLCQAQIENPAHLQVMEMLHEMGAKDFSENKRICEETGYDLAAVLG